MSHQKKFDYTTLDINRVVNEQIGKLKNTRIHYTYARIPKITKSKGKDNSKNKRNNDSKKKSNLPAISNEHKSQEKNNIHAGSFISNNTSMSKDKENSKNFSNKGHINVLKAKIVKKKNYDHVERVVIDLVNNDDSDTIKSDSILSSKNIYENAIKNKSSEIYDNLENKDNNICHNGVNDINTAINMIESRWKNNFASTNENNIQVLCDEIAMKKKEIEIILNRWNNIKKINEDKLSIYSENTITKKWIINSQILKEVDLDFSVDEIKTKEKTYRSNLNKWINNNQKLNVDKISFFVEEMKVKEKEINNIINRWKNEIKTEKGDNILYSVDEALVKNKNMNKIKTKWNNDNQGINSVNISFLVDELKIKEKEFNNLMNKWKNGLQLLNGENMAFLVDENKMKEKQINNNINRWNENNKNINLEKWSFLVDPLFIKKNEINNIIKRWNNGNKNVKNENISFIIDNLKIKQKEINNIITRWNNANKNIITENISYTIDALKIKKKENNKIITRWKNECQNIITERISLIKGNLNIKEKESKESNNIVKRWNNENKNINLEKISFIPDDSNIKENRKKKILKDWKESNQNIIGDNFSFINNNAGINILKGKKKEKENTSNKWDNVQIENKIILSFEVIRDKTTFKYSEKNYINDLIQNIYLSENNTNHFFILCKDNNERNLNKINYKEIKPNNRNELGLEVYNFYNQTKNIDNNINISEDISNNNINQNIINNRNHINPIFILNNENIKQLYDEIYKGSAAVIESKKEWSETTLTVAKQIRIDYEVVEPYSHSENNKNSSEVSNIDKKSEKTNDNKKEKSQASYIDFGQSTPLSLLHEKYYLYAVSRINKCSVNSPQPYISIFNKYSKVDNENNKNYFDLDRLDINHFSLMIERIDKLDSSKSSETRDKQ